MTKTLSIQLKTMLWAVALLAFNTTVQAQNWNEIIKKTASDRNSPSLDPAGTWEYGYSMQVSGNYAIATANEDSRQTVYILRLKNGKWVQIKRITPTFATWSGGSQDQAYVAINGDFAVVGAPYTEEDSLEANDLTDAGSAYVLEKNKGGADNWGLVKKLKATSPQIGDRFGSAVAVSGDYIVVGATNDDLDASGQNAIPDAGSTFIFRKDASGAGNWGLTNKVTAIDRSPSDLFGSAVDIDGDQIIVGAPQGNGAAYVFSKPAGQADGWEFTAQLVAADGDSGDQFGASVAIDNGIVIAGAPADEDNQTGTSTRVGAGSAYIFEKDRGGIDHWGQLKKIIASDRDIYNAFGRTVAIDGSYIVVGAPIKNEGYGAVYVFRQSRGGSNYWGEVRNIPNPGLEDFGRAVSISGETMAVTPYYGQNNEGGLFFYNKDEGGTENWGQTQRMTRYTVFPIKYYGYSVAADGDYAVVGAPREDTDSASENFLENAGAAYILKNNNGNWEEIKKITAPVRLAAAGFGTSVGINGSAIIVGTPDQNAFTGTAYIFEENQGGTGNWGVVSELTRANPAGGDLFANTVTISGDYAAVGAPGEDHGALETNPITNAGAAYLYQKSPGGSWVLLKKIVAPVRAFNDQLGYSIALSGDNLMVGSPTSGTDSEGQNELYRAGSVYFHSKNTGGTNAWGVVQKLTSTNRVESEGFGNKISVDGGYAAISSFNLASFVYVFKQSGTPGGPMQFVKRLEKPVSPATSFFGNSLSLKGDRLVIATRSDSSFISIYKKDLNGADNWGLEKRTRPDVALGNNNLGFNVALDSNYVFVGVPLDDLDENQEKPVEDAGSVAIFLNDDPLPVTLAAFEAQKVENSVSLRWTTASEHNASRFEILRSPDARSWTEIGQVSAAGESTTGEGYTFTDTDPLPGINYYRLKMRDEDGTFAFSMVREVRVSGISGIYPNPAVEQFQLPDMQSEKIRSVAIWNAAGKQVMENRHPAGVITVNGLPAGSYVLKVSLKSGEITTHKLVIAGH